jgi:hypothetical protein
MSHGGHSRLGQSFVPILFKTLLDAIRNDCPASSISRWVLIYANNSGFPYKVDIRFCQHFFEGKLSICGELWSHHAVTSYRHGGSVEREPDLQGFAIFKQGGKMSWLKEGNKPDLMGIVREEVTPSLQWNSKLHLSSNRNWWLAGKKNV